MKRIILLITFIYTVLNASAQDSVGGKRSPERIAQIQYKQVLQHVSNLAEEQKAALQTVFIAFGKELSAVLAERGRKKKQLFQIISNRKDAQVKKILTKEQQQEYEQLIDDWKEKMQKRQRNRNR
jgi:HSP90 family molecular chaperone